MFRDPLQRNRFLRSNYPYDRSDVIVENKLSKKRVFQDVESNAGMIEGGTRNTVLMSSYNTIDESRDVTVSVTNANIVGRLERNRPPERPGKKHTRRYY